MKNSKARIWRMLLVAVRCLVIPPAVLQLIHLISSADSAEWTLNSYTLCISIQIAFASFCMFPFPTRMYYGRSKWILLGVIMVLTVSMLRYHLVGFTYISTQAQDQPDLVADYERAKNGPPGFSSFGLDGGKMAWLVEVPKWHYWETPLLLAFSGAPLLLFALKHKVIKADLTAC